MSQERYRLPGRVRRVVASLAPIVCPGDVVELGLVEEVVAATEALIGATPPHLRAGLSAGLLAFDLAAAALPSSRGRPFSRLDEERARAWFHTVWTSRFAPLHELAKAIKALIVMGYFEHPVIKRRLGYRPEEWIAEVKHRRSERFADDIRRHDEILRAPAPLVPAARIARKVSHGR